MNEIINELLSLVELLKKSKIDAEKHPDLSVEDAIDAVNDMIASLQLDDTDVLDKVAYLFISGSNVYRIAASNEWTSELKQIGDKVGKHIGYIRTMQKNNPTYFDNVKPLNNNTYASAPGRLTVSKKSGRISKKHIMQPFLKYYISIGCAKIFSVESATATLNRRLLCLKTRLLLQPTRMKWMPLFF